MCVREASLVPRSYTCCALPHAAVTSRSYKKAKETAVRDIPSPNGYRRCTVPGRHPNIYWVDRVRARCAIIARLLGGRPQEAEMVLRVFQFLPSSIHTTSYIRKYIIRSHLSRRVGFRSYTSHMLERTRMFRRERDTMSYVFAIRLFSLDELKSIAHPYMFHG